MRVITGAPGPQMDTAVVGAPGVFTEEKQAAQYHWLSVEEVTFGSG
jgi:hypothetical protein